MRHYTAKRILSLPRLSHLLYDDQDNFTPEKLITDLGLYEGVLIDTEEIDCKFSKTPSPHTMKDIISLDNAYVSEDVKALHHFLLFDDNTMLPCAECKRDQVFSPMLAFNPQQLDTITLKDKYEMPYNQTIIVPIDQGMLPAGTSTTRRIFDPLRIIYCSGKDEMRLIGNQQVNEKEIDTNKAALSCVEGISQHFSEIRRDFVCSLDKSHHVTAYYIIHKATDVCREKNESAEYEKLNYCLVLEKVGQEPSMADLQMFDIEKYRKVLSDNSFRDFSMALGLYASGVGCGSLLYLRRIYETLIKDAHDKCSSMPGWDENEYNKRRFNEKMGYLEGFGAKIIPDELSDVKAKIYGWLSKGVHELPEQESMELFPHLKLAMELILDEQIAQKDREEKLKGLKKTLQK